MATPAVMQTDSLKENFDDLLTCSICLETFKDPKYLPCLHTFCEACIHTYINSTDNEEKPTGFKCPPDERIKIYCKDHTKPCCTVCATVHHRKCAQVVTIDKAVCGVKDSTKAHNLKNKLKDKSDHLCKVLQNRKENISAFEKETEAIQKEISNVRKKLNKHLDKLEQHLKDEVRSTQKSNVIKLNDEAIVISTLKSTIDNWKNIFEACLFHGSELQCLITMEDIFCKLPQFEEDLSKSVREIRDLSVKIKVTDVIEKVDSLGSVNLNERRPSISGIKTTNFLTGKFKVVFTINISGPNISGIFFNDYIVITDYSCKTIVSHDSNGQKKKELNVQDSPTDITKVNDETVAVSSYPHKIFEINVETMTLLRTLTVDVNVWGLCFVGDEYVTAQNNTISWLNSKTGAKLRCCTTGANTPFVTCNQSTKYIYTNGTNSIRQESTTEKCFDYNGKSLEYTYSQAIDYDGNIYAVGRESKNIHQLTSAGELVRIIPLSDIDSTMTDLPWVMRFKDDSNKFLLTFYSTGKVRVCEVE
ncbi:uncharacterized protein LOC134718265 [Mytilus trossulus]|uniref:uncharacterized protein LOC134718265 n=1 Tax=Mytilus trossulus TaxID=6551 RepID=UPI003007AD93